MSQRSKQPIKIKGLLLIGKLVFYLFLYVHWLACLWNMIVQINGPQVYHVQRDGTYIDIDGDPLLDEAGNQVHYNGLNMIF